MLAQGFMVWYNMIMILCKNAGGVDSKKLGGTGISGQLANRHASVFKQANNPASKQACRQ